MDSNKIPKWKRYGSEADGFIRGNCTIAVIVEDCTSASVVETLGLTGVAILGTTLNQNHIQGLKNYKKVIVALIQMKHSKTIEYTRKLKANGIDAFALKLLDDIKYRRAEDIAYLNKLKRSSMEQQILKSLLNKEFYDSVQEGKCPTQVFTKGFTKDKRNY